jgi:hypothetical protein
MRRLNMAQKVQRKIEKKNEISPQGKETTEFELILKHLEDYGTATIGKCHYYIRSEGKSAHLCRTVVGYGKLYSSEVLDHRRYGISEDDIDQAISCAPPRCEIPGYYPISDHIDKKLRPLFD